MERVPGASAMAEGVLLDALATLVELVPCEGDDVERVHHRDHIIDGLGGGGFVAGEPVHRDDLDPVTELL